MTEKEQDYCSRCKEKINPKKLITIVSRTPKSTNIILVCTKCHKSYLHWIKDGIESKKRIKEYYRIKEFLEKREHTDENIEEKLKFLQEQLDRLLGRKKRRQYADEAEWWLEKRYRTDKQGFKKEDLSDDEKEDLK